METRYYTVEQIKELENCGRDRAYAIARKLPHKSNGKKILVLKEAYEEYYQKEKEKILYDFNNETKEKQKVYQIKKFV